MYLEPRTANAHLPLGGGSRSSGLRAPALSAGLGIARRSPVGGGGISVPAATWCGSGGLVVEGNGVGASDLPLLTEAISGRGGTDLLGARGLGLLDGGVLVLLGLGVAVEVQIGHDVPLGLAGSEGAAETEDLTGQHPPDETDGVATLVVGGDGNINVLSRGVAVAESL